MPVEKLWKLAENKRSRIILAVDFTRLPQEASKILRIQHLTTLLRELRHYVAGVKIGFPLSLQVDFEGIKYIIEEFREDYYFIADFKLADIPDVVEYELNELSAMGFDGAIIHLFPLGYGEVIRKTSAKIDIYGLIVMSHKGAIFFEENFERLLEYASSIYEIAGVVVGATRLNYIKKARKTLKEKIILSPGVGIQGTPFGEALKHGADFEIIGRSITLSTNPRKKAKEIIEKQILTLTSWKKQRYII
ncbi:MAG TPA: orotidine-5'-phosphate decarboxylase [Thermoproteales archaeon]|nr:orotidine-5'-phosphate decarboxylase [Thermoproteales archaeon]